MKPNRLSTAVAAFFALLWAAPASAADLILDVASGYLVDAQINGVPVRLRVDPETSGYIILNAHAAQRIGLRRSMLGATTVIGPVRLRGSPRLRALRSAGLPAAAASCGPMPRQRQERTA